MLKRIGVSILTAIAFLTAVAQKSTSYEIEKDYPLFLEKMKQELTYPMAWGIVPRLIFPSGGKWPVRLFWMQCWLHRLLPKNMVWKLWL